MRKLIFLEMTGLFVWALLMPPIGSLASIKNPIVKHVGPAIKHAQSKTAISNGTANALNFLSYDFGDAPAVLTCVDASFTNVYASLGANAVRHQLVAGVYLGTGVSDEASSKQPASCISTPNSLQEANSDDLDDGVVFKSIGSKSEYLYAGLTNTIQVTASAPGFVSIWIDQNQNGVFDASERLLHATAVVAGSNTLSLPVYSPNFPTGQTYCRVRYASVAAEIANPDGLANSGEVEDYRVHIVRKTNPCGSQLDNGSFETPAFSSGTRIISESDMPGWSTFPNAPNLTFSGINDFTARNSIEIWSNGANGGPNAKSGTHYVELNAYVSGTLYEDIETAPGQVFVWRFSHRGRNGTETMKLFIVPAGDPLNTPITTVSDGTSAWGNYTNTYTVPAGQYITRFAFQAVDAGSSGNFLDDIAFSTSCEFGDAPDNYKTLAQSGGAAHSTYTQLHLGATANSKTDGQPSAEANLDLNDDGIVFFPSLSTGEIAKNFTISVSTYNNLGANAKLLGWIDFNIDGAFQANEMAMVDVASGTSSVNLSWLIPSTTIAGKTYARLRIIKESDIMVDDAGTTNLDERAVGSALTGEVEDYTLTILPGTPGGVASNLSLWLDASSGSTGSNGLLTNWLDKTGINQFTKVGNPEWLDGSLNFQPVVRFTNNKASGANQVAPTQSLRGNTSITYSDGFIVFKPNGSTNFATIGSANNPISPALYGFNFFGSTISKPNHLTVSNGDPLRVAYLPFGFKTDSLGYWIANMDLAPTTPPYVSGSLNGKSLTMVNDHLDVLPSNFVPMIGGTNGNGSSLNPYPFNGNIAEAILYSQSLSATEKQKIETYLAIKYGLTKTGNYLSSNNQVLWDTTANTGFNNHIFGIGRDDQSTLNQKIAKPNPSNAKSSGDLIIANGNLVPANIPANNQVFANSIASDNNAFLLGDNGQAYTFSESLNGLPNKRMAKIWKVQKTGNAINEVSFLLPDFGTNINRVIGLLLSADGKTWTPAADKIMSYDSVNHYYYLKVDLAAFSTKPYFSFADLTFSIEFEENNNNRIDKTTGNLTFQSYESVTKPSLIRVRYWGVVRDAAEGSFSVVVYIKTLQNIAVNGDDYQMPASTPIQIAPGNYFDTGSVAVDYRIIPKLNVFTSEKYFYLNLNPPNNDAKYISTAFTNTHLKPSKQIVYKILNETRVVKLSFSVDKQNRTNFRFIPNTTEGDTLNTRVGFVIARSGETAFLPQETVRWKVVPKTQTGKQAADPTDFVGDVFPSGTYTFWKNQTNTAFHSAIIHDSLINAFYIKADRKIEMDKSYQLELDLSTSMDARMDTTNTPSQPKNIDLSIIDDDLPNAANRQISLIFEQSGAEGGNNPSFSVKLPTGITAAEDLPIDLSFSGTATQGLDYHYTTTNKKWVIKAGTNGLTETIPVIDDNQIESLESIVVKINPSGTSFNGLPFTLVGPQSLILNITDNDNLPANRVISATVVKPSKESPDVPTSEGKIRFSLPGNLVANSDIKFNVIFDATGSSVDVNNDVWALNDTVVTIPAGQNSVDLNVYPFEDNIIEGDENLQLRFQGLREIGANNSYSFVANTLLLPVQDDDNNDLYIGLVPVKYQAFESDNGLGPNGSVIATIYRPNSTVNYTRFITQRPLTVSYEVLQLGNNPALPGVNYIALPGTVVIPTLNDGARIDVKAINDQVLRPDATFAIRILGATDGVNNYLPIDNTQGVIYARAAFIVIDNDRVKANETINVVAKTNAISENGGVGNFEFSIPKQSAVPIDVYYSITGNAESGKDFQTLSGTVTIPANQLTVSLPITAIPDDILENSEDIIVTIDKGKSSIAQYAAGNNPTASISITDFTSTSPTNKLLSITSTVQAAEPKSSGRFKIAFPAGITNSDSTVVYFTKAGTAISGIDYAATKDSVVIPANTNFVDLPLDIVDDKIIENEETVIVTIASIRSNLTPTLLADPKFTSAKVTIADDDNIAKNLIIRVDAAAMSAENPYKEGKFIVSLPKGISSAQPITFHYSLSGDANNGKDFNLIGNNVIPAGQNSVELTVEPIDDKIIEPTELVAFNLIGANDAANHLFVVSNARATVSIDDDDSKTASSTLLTASNLVAGAEPNSPASFKISLPAGYTASTDIAIKYTIAGTALDGTDYTSPTNMVIPAGREWVVVNMPVLDDQIIEGNETIQIIVDSSNMVNGGIRYRWAGSNIIDLTINDDDLVSANLAIQVTKISDAQEGGSPGIYRFAFAQPVTSAKDITIQYSFTGTARVDTNYLAPLASISIPAGSTEILLPILPVQDILIRPTTSLLLNCTNITDGVNSYQGSTAVSMDIFDDDAPLSSAKLSVSKISDPSEPGTDGSFRVTLPFISTEEIKIHYALSGSAQMGIDYEHFPSSIVIPAYSDRVIIPIKVKNDLIVEGDEDISITLLGGSSNSFQYLPFVAAATAVINDDDTAAANRTLVIDQVVNTSEPAGTGSFIIKLPAGVTASEPINIVYAVKGTATEGLDYLSLNRSATIDAGKNSVLVNLTVQNDQILEGDETVQLNLLSASTPNLYFMVDSTVSKNLVIADDENLAANFYLSVTKLNDAAEPNGANSGFKITLPTGMVVKDSIRIQYKLAGTATENKDYLALGTLTLPADVNSIDVPISVIDDKIIEGNEQIEFQLLDSKSANGLFNFSPSKNGKASIELVDDDTSFASKALRISNLSNASEPLGNGQFRIALPAGYTAAQDIYAFFGLAGTATAGTDYQNLDQFAVIKSGDNAVDISVKIIDDKIIEPTESIEISLFGGIGTDGILYDHANDATSVLISDDDNTIANKTISIAKIADIQEGGADGVISFTLPLGITSSKPITITLDKKGTAIVGTDYIDPGTIVFPANTNSISIPFKAFDDQIIKPVSTLIVGISAATDGTTSFIANPAAPLDSMHIFDNDATLSNLKISIAKQTDATEHLSNGLFRISIPTLSSENIQVGYQLTGTATNAKDYLSIGSVVIPAGKLFVDVLVNIIDDNEIEGNETVTMELVSASSKSFQYLLDVKTATLTIADDDALVKANTIVSVYRVQDGTEGKGNGRFKIQLPPGITSKQDILINFDLAGTAVQNEDYTTPYSGVILKSGNNGVDVVMSIVQDKIVENTESISITLVNALSNQGAAFTIDSTAKEATVNVYDDDNTVNNNVLTVATTQGASEPSSNGSFTVSLPVGITISEAVTVNYQLGGTATSGKDYVAIGTVLIPAGVNSVLVPVTVIDDQLIEGTETLSFEIIGGASSSFAFQPGASNVATMALLDDDATASKLQLSISKVADVAEPSTEGSIKISLPTGVTATEKIQVQLAISNSSTATSGNDYTLNTSIEIAAGNNSVTVPVKAIDDRLIEGTESIVLNLSGGTSNSFAYTAATGSTTLTVNVLDDDNNASSASLVIEKVSDAFEGGSNGLFSIHLPTGVTSAVPIQINIGLTGTATSLLDYTAIGSSGQLVLPAFTNELLVPVVVVDDALVEGLETLALTMSSASSSIGTVAITTASALINVIDNDLPSISTEQVSVVTTSPASEAATNGSFTVNLSAAATTDVTISYTVVGSTAVAGKDYQALGTILIPAGSSTVTVPIVVIDDQMPELLEFVKINLVGASATSRPYTVNPAQASATVNISDNDQIPANFILSISKVADAAEPSSNGSFKVSLPTGVLAGTDIQFTTNLSGTAVANKDYSIGLGSIAAGSNSVTIPVTVIDNLLLDGNRTLLISLNTATDGFSSTYTFDASALQASLQIVDNDTLAAYKQINIATLTNGKEPNKNGSFRISVPTGYYNTQPITVNYVVSGTATAGADYTSLSGTAVIPLGAGFVDVTVQAKDDKLIEGLEKIIITLQSANNGFTIGTAASTVIDLVDDDDLFVSNGQSNNKLILSKITDGAEPGSNGLFRISLPAGYTLQDNLVIGLKAGGTAVAGRDYNGLPVQVTLPAGANFIDLPFTVIDDKIVEGDRLLNLEITSAKTNTLSFLQGVLSATAFIRDDETTPSLLQLTVSKIKDAEELNAVSGQFRISLPAGTVVSQNVFVNYRISGTALPGVDYTNIVQSITIPAGANFVDVMVPVLNDTLQEPVETVIMNLSGGISAAGILFTSTSSATVNIINRGGDLQVTKEILSPSNAKAVLGTTVEYLIKVAFTGTINYHQVIVTDSLPAGLSDPLNIQVGTGSVSYDKNTRKITWLIDSIKSGESFQMGLFVKVAEGGTIVNQVSVLANESELSYSNNKATISLVGEGVDIFIPNTITPNGDGKNDKWIIPALSRYTGADMTIYNRWGTQVFHSVNYNNDWDAAGLGGGTYYYVLKLSAAQNNKIYKGYIEVLK